MADTTVLILRKADTDTETRIEKEFDEETEAYFLHMAELNRKRKEAAEKQRVIDNADLRHRLGLRAQKKK